MAASYPNNEVVAPISAPMLQMVALPVQLIDSAPGPKYSTMAPVPPLTVRISATFRMMSLGADELRPTDVEREAGHDVDRVGATDPDGDHAEAAGVRGVAVGADHHPAGEGVLLEHDLVDDAGSGAPEADAVLGRHALQELVH